MILFSLFSLCAFAKCQSGCCADSVGGRLHSFHSPAFRRAPVFAGAAVFKLDQDHVMLQTVPDVSFHRLDEGAIYYVVMASDGLWDYTSMDKVDHQNTYVVPASCWGR